LLDGVIQLPQGFVLGFLVAAVDHQAAQPEDYNQDHSKHHSGRRTTVQLSPEGDDLNRMVVHYLSSLVVDPLHPNVLNIFAYVLGEGYLLGVPFADGLGLGGLQLLHLGQTEHY